MPASLLFRMPKLGLTMEEGIVTSWQVAEGDRFAAGQTLVVVETDKIASELEAPGAGVLRRKLAHPGEVKAVGEALAELDIDATGESKTPESTMPGRIVATPLARRLAREADVDLRLVVGSGPRGRIRARDLPAATPPDSAPTGAASADDWLAQARQLRVAQRMVTAKRDTPHFYLASEVEVTALEALRAQLKAEGRRLTLTHLLLAAIVRALCDTPHLNRIWRDDRSVRLDSIDVGLAIAAPSGLVAPTLRNLERATIWQIAAHAEALTARARAGSLTAADGGGAPMMTLSNAGMHDVTWMTSIIPPGQAAILGVGTTRAVFRPDAQGRPELRRELGLVLSCDHRVFDGVTGLALLNAIRMRLTRPIGLLLDSRTEG